jgi:hypothetical protein
LLLLPFELLSIRTPIREVFVKVNSFFFVITRQKENTQNKVEHLRQIRDKTAHLKQCVGRQQ